MSRKAFFPILIKLLIPMLVSIFVIASITAALVSADVKKNWLNDTLETVSAYDVSVETLFENEKDGLKNVTDELATLVGTLMGAGIPTEAINPMCLSLKTHFSLESVAVYGVDENLITDPSLTGRVEVSDNMRAAFKGNTSCVYYEFGGTLVAVCTVPLYVNGTIIGGVESAKCLSTPEFIQYVKEVTGCEFTVIYKDTRTSSTITQLVGQKISEDLFNRLTNNEKVVEEIKLDGKPYGACYWAMPNLPTETKELFLFVGKDIEVMEAACKKEQANIFLMIISLNVFVILLLGVFTMIIILRPLKRTRKAMWNLSSGDADLTYRLPEKGNDEITDLSRAVNKFLNNLHGIMKDINDETGHINDSVNDLGASAQETASATSEIIANIQSVKNEAQTQSNVVAEAGELVQNSIGNMKELKTNLELQMQDVQETSAIIEQMIGNTHSVTESANKLKSAFSILEEKVRQGEETVVSCANVIKKVDEKSKDLSGANETISSIAAQTNLLAMNAAIEAAHAGEAGRGFAVVAGEIRKLAEDSSKQAQKIQESISDITDLITQGTELSAHSKESLEEIGHQSENVNPLVLQITNAMDEQNSGTTQVLNALGKMKSETANVDNSADVVNNDLVNISNKMDDVNQVSSVIYGSMDEMTNGSQQINSATQNVSDLAVNTQADVKSITAKISQFKV